MKDINVVIIYCLFIVSLLLLLIIGNRVGEWLLKLKGAGCQEKGGIMKRIVKWLIAKYLPGYHLAKNPPKGKRNRRSRIREQGSEGNPEEI